MFFHKLSVCPRSYLVRTISKNEASPGTNDNMFNINSGQNRELDLSLEKSFDLTPK